MDIYVVSKRHFLSHLYIRCNILPRQARDKHRENSKKVPFSLSTYATAAAGGVSESFRNNILRARDEREFVDNGEKRGGTHRVNESGPLML